jgi:hypothetical protein
MAEHPILFCGEMVRAILAGRKTETRRICTERNVHKYSVGDTLWVRETFSIYRHPTNPVVHYRADSGDDDKILKWKPSIFMPRWASRINLKVVMTIHEHTSGINEDDARAEGVNNLEEYAKLWNKINGKKAPWEGDPWIIAIKFEVLKNK